MSKYVVNLRKSRLVIKNDGELTHRELAEISAQMYIRQRDIEREMEGEGHTPQSREYWETEHATVKKLQEKIQKLAYAYGNNSLYGPPF